MKAQEKGAVLAIGLLILLVLTIIGVTAMRVTVLDERIASNAQFKMLTFQAAESALVIASSLENITTFATSGVSPDPSSFDTDLAGAQGKLSVTVNTGIEDRGEMPLLGSSMAVGRTGAAALQVYEITADAAFDDDTALSTHRLAIGRVVPSAVGR